MIVSLVAAASTNRVIGVGNDLPWQLPADMQFFKQTTENHHILMGRKTWEILGKPLPKRISIVISTQKLAFPEGVFRFDTVQQGLSFARSQGENELMVIGGGQIYEAALPLADRLYLTHVYTQVENGTAYFPPVLATDWAIKSSTYREKDEKNQFDMEFLVLERMGFLG